MYASVKFFEPSVTAGLPFPGCPLAAAVDPPLDSELLLLDPHAARPIASATASRAVIARYQVRPVIPFRLLRLGRLEHGALGLYPAPPTQRTRCGVSLEQSEESVDRKRQHRDEQRRGHHAHEAVAGLIRDHVAQPSDRARERGERRGCNHVE